MKRLGRVLATTGLAAALSLIAVFASGPAQAATWTNLGGNVNSDGSWTYGSVQRYFAGGSKQIWFRASNLPGCCLDIQIHDYYDSTFWGAEWNIQATYLNYDFILCSGDASFNYNAQDGNGSSWSQTNSGYFRVWYRNAGSQYGDTYWEGQLAYNYPD